MGSAPVGPGTVLGLQKEVDGNLVMGTVYLDPPYAWCMRVRHE